MPKQPKLTDQLLSFVKQKMRDASIRDLAFLSAFIAGTYIAYSAIKGLEKLPKEWFTPGLPAFQDVSFLADFVVSDPTSVAIAMVSSYKFLTTDMEDLKSIISLVKAIPIVG